MEPDSLLTCYLLETLLHEYRVVAVYYDESIEEHFTPRETACNQISFDKIGGARYIYTLLENYGREKTGGFIADIMTIGVHEIIRFTKKRATDPSAEPSPPEKTVSDEYLHIYQDLIVRYGFELIRLWCLHLMGSAMRMLVYRHTIGEDIHINPN